jgi:hypothetical protein
MDKHRVDERVPQQFHERCRVGILFKERRLLLRTQSTFRRLPMMGWLLSTPGALQGGRKYRAIKVNTLARSWSRGDPRPRRAPNYRLEFRFVRLVAAADLSIRKSSIFLPVPLVAAFNHLGIAPRPAHVSPSGPRYFGATFFPFNALPRPLRAILPPVEAIEPPSAANCLSSVERCETSVSSICLRRSMSS